MAGFGESLRQAREARKITLQEISATTKIGTRLLQALEDERFDLLPGGIFNKGFVRSYARCVGLDEQKMVAAYVAAANLPEPEVNIQQISTQVAVARGHAKSGLSAATVMGVVALLVAIALGAVWLREQRKEARETAPHPAAQAATPVAVVPPPAASPGNPNSASAAGAAAPSQDAPNASSPATPNPTPITPSTSDKSAALNPSPKPTQGTASTVAAKSPSKLGAAPVEISITATKRAWISVSSDGKAEETLTLDPEKPELRSRSFKANQRLLLVVGNPAGVTVTYNGKPTGKLGIEGQRATITFTPKGIEKQ